MVKSVGAPVRVDFTDRFVVHWFGVRFMDAGCVILVVLFWGLVPLAPGGRGVDGNVYANFFNFALAYVGLGGFFLDGSFDFSGDGAACVWRVPPEALHLRRAPRGPALPDGRA